ncbi:hypothetical protein BH09PSE5_BH09PSE5_50590 [soil metagenome]
MQPRLSLLFTVLMACQCLQAGHAVAADHSAPATPEVTPLVRPSRGGGGSSAPLGSMERLKQRLEEKLGATADPEGDRVVRVINKSPVKEAAPTKASGSKAGTDTVVAAASMAAGAPILPGTHQHTGAAQAGQASASRPLAPWDYHGAGAPHKWGSLDPAYSTCSSGKRQSPIDIRDGIQVELEPLRFEYKPSSFSVIDDGHTVQVNVAPGNFVSVMGRRFELVEFHFHRPAEEVVEGKRYDMVVHMLHRDEQGKLAMVAVLLDKGTPQQVVQAVWNNLPLERGEAVPARVELDPMQLLPVDRNYFTYMGSLTMPPCTEGVLWMVLRQPVQVSEEQIDIFSRLYPMNARPLQEASGRLIKQN